MLIQLCAWNDPAEDPSWLRCDHDDALWYLTPLLGPTSTIVLHHTARWLTASAGLPHAFGLNALSAMFGVAPNSMMHTLKRIEQFGLARNITETDGKNHITYEVRMAVPPMSRRFARRLPDSFLQDCPYLGFVPTETEPS